MSATRTYKKPGKKRIEFTELLRRQANTPKLRTRTQANSKPTSWEITIRGNWIKTFSHGRATVDSFFPNPLINFVHDCWANFSFIEKFALLAVSALGLFRSGQMVQYKNEGKKSKIYMWMVASWRQCDRHFLLNLMNYGPFLSWIFGWTFITFCRHPSRHCWMRKDDGDDVAVRPNVIPISDCNNSDTVITKFFMFIFSAFVFRWENKSFSFFYY